MKKRLGYVLLFIIAGFLNLHAQEGGLKVSKVKVYLPSEAQQRNAVTDLLDLDHFYEEDGAIISEFSEEILSKLQAANVHYEVLIDDMVLHLKELNDQYYAEQKAVKEGGIIPLRAAIEQPGGVIDDIIVRPAAFQVMGTFGGYYSFAQMNTAMDALVAAYPAIASKTQIGTTVGSRAIWVIKISDNVATDEANEPEVLYMGLQHPREAITGASMIFFMQYLCERYAADTRIKNLVDNREFYIIPCFNPDGYEYNRTTNPNGGGAWRKNRRANAGGSFGVDLNRNWGVDWANCNAPIQGPPASCGSGTASAETYWGTAAFSEAETQAVRNFTKSRHIVAGFDQHAYGPYYSLPFGRKIAGRTMSVKGQNFFTAVPALMGKYNGMRAADSYDALSYEVAGGFKDWMLIGELGTGTGGGLKDTVWAMTGEGAAGGGTPANGAMANFWAPAAQIVNLCKGMCYQNLQLAYAAGTYVDMQDANDVALTAKTGNLNVAVKRLGLGNGPVTISLIPLENINAVGAPVTISSMVYYETLTKSISYTLHPHISNGHRVRYAWKVETGGYTYSDTVVKFFNPTQLFYDDMEGTFATNWTSASNVADKWDYTALAAYGGTRALTESPTTTSGSNYTASTTRTLTFSGASTGQTMAGAFNLTGATASYLTFWTKHRAENFRDKLQVQVSTNGTAWTTIEGKTTLKEPGTLDGATIDGQPSLTGIRDYWTQEVFNLAAYNGQSALRLRFVFTSDNDPSGFKFEVDDGFYIDNLKVIKSVVPLILLPSNFLTFTGELQPDKTVRLKWTAELNESHDYFEVQRSADNSRFTVIGKVGRTFEYRDMAPQSGTNFYRIRQVDKNGESIYSKVISLTTAADVIVSAYPNPVHDRVFINLHSSQPELFDVRITDLSGRVVYSRRYYSAVAAELSVDMKQWLPQTYVLKIMNSKNEVVTTRKIIKY